MTKGQKAQADALRGWLKAVAAKGKDGITTNERAALTRALLFLYARQTADEQQSGATAHFNGMGFSGCDAEFLSNVARSAQKYGGITAGQAPYVAKKLAKYTGQLLELAQQKMPEPVAA